MSVPITEQLRHTHGFMKTVAITVVAAFLSLSLQPLALAAQTIKTTAPKAEPDSTDKLAKTIEAIEAKLDKLDQKLTNKLTADTEKAELQGLKRQLNDQDKTALDDFAKIEKHLQDKKLPKVIIDRHAAALKQYREEMVILKANLDALDQAKDDEDRKIKTKKAKDHLKAKQKKAKRGPVDPNNLPTRALKPNKNNKPKLRKEDFRAAGLYDQPTVKLAALGDFKFDKLPGASDPAYLAETMEINFSPAIKAKAQELNYDPVQIYQFVRNNAEWIPSWGSIQGAELALKHLKGNAFDTASLLIALLRASGIPARYVHGTLDIPADRFMNWAGGFTSSNSAWEFASAGGVPIAALTAAGKIAAFRMEHIWVEVAIDYYPSHGAVNKAADTWLQLDASFKQYVITPGTDVTSTIAFSADNYLSQIRSDSPIQYYQQQIQAYLDTNLPDKTLGEIMGFRFIQVQESQGLPSILPYRTLLAANRYSSLPASLRALVQLEFQTAEGLAVDTLPLATTEIAGKRLTLSYLPATSADEALIASHGGDLYAVPPYLLYLKPVLKADGVSLYTGGAIPMGQEHRLAVTYQTPTVFAASMPNKLIAGGYYAIGLNLQGVNEHVLGHHNHRLIETLTTQTADSATNDDTLGEHLTALMLTYYLMNDKFYRGAAKLYQVEEQRTLSAGLVGIAPTVRYFFGIPRSASPNRLQADVGLEAIQAASKEGNPNKLKTFLELRGLIGSFSEHAVFEAIHGFDSISAVKAIQASSAQGVPIFKIDQANATQLLPQLQLAVEDKQEIQDGIAVGLIAIVPQREITFNDWRGTGFILKDPQTSSGVYRVSGGLSGGSTTKGGDGFQIVSLFKGAYARIKDKLDVMMRAFIAEAATVDAATGEKIAETAKELAETKAGYEDVNQCSGLVRRAYAAAGICLDNFAGSGGCKDNLVQRSGITGSHGVSYHYNLANFLKINNSVRTTNDPLVGDIVFFSNTTGPGHPLNHEGIVVKGPDANGTIKFIHAILPGVVGPHFMNILRKNDPSSSVNSFIGARGQCGSECLSGQLFSGYGTVRDPSTLK